MAAQAMAPSERIDAMPQVRQGTLNAPLAPGRILFRHTEHELLDLSSDTRSAKRASLLTSVKLLGDQALVPA
jgi:hypothetical protein